MVSLGRDIEQIGRMVTLITDAFTIRLIQIGEQRLGAPPLPYAWIVFGSQAREAQTARTDQDNGIVLKRDAVGDEVTYFEKLSEFVCDGLDKLGYVYCPGEIMALNVKWRVSLDKWKRHFDGWIDQPTPKSVMYSSIFFDIRCVYGECELVDELQSAKEIRKILEKQWRGELEAVKRIIKLQKSIAQSANGISLGIV